MLSFPFQCVRFLLIYFHYISATSLLRLLHKIMRKCENESYISIFWQSSEPFPSNITCSPKRSYLENKIQGLETSHIGYLNVTHQYCNILTCAWELFLKTLVNPRRACAARVTVLGLCVCVSVCVCLLLNISLFTFHVFVPQTILTFLAADEGRNFK